MKVPMSEKDQDFASMLAEFEQRNPDGGRSLAQVGDSVRGRVTSLGQETAVVEIAGGAGDGMIGLDELRDEDGNLTVKVGDDI
jgi:ribosomal protein S1